jgi:uncharacterized membrane protein YhhN
MDLYWAPLALLAVSVVLLIRAEFAEDHARIRVFKPISSSLLVVILLLSFARPGQYRADYTLAMLAGMLLCFGGDMALMFQQNLKAFRAGLALFLLGHVVYSIVFAAAAGFRREDAASGAVLLALAVALYLYLRPGLGGMKAPVVFYIVVISFMMNRAVSTFHGGFFNRDQAVMITLGAALFYVSDVILAVSRFRKRWRYNRVSLAFYYGGQALLMLSAGFF